MIETYDNINSHYGAVIELIQRNPYEVISITYSTGRTRNDREASGWLAGQLNWLGLAISELDRRVKSKLIQRAVVVTTEQPQEVEALTEYNGIEWRQHDANHSKIWVFKFKKLPPVVILGSRNLTSTVFHEISVRLEGEDAQRAVDMAEMLVKQSQSLEDQPDWFGEATELMDQSDL